MCSVGDDNIEEESASKYLPSKPLLNLSEIKCNKCRENVPKILLRVKDAYCEKCFLTATTHKFKAQLGKNKLVRHGDRVLVQHMGGHASAALLHFLKTGLDLSTPRKFKFTPIFVYIYENKLPANIQELINEVKRYDFEIFICSLYDYIANPSSVAKLLKSNIELTDLNSDLKLIANKTNQLDFLGIQKRLLLIDAAKHLKCNIIFTPEIAADIATSLLTNVSLGRGAHLSLDIGLCDNRDPDVKIIRPLRMFDIKELVFYNYFSKINTVIFIENMKYNGSVQNLLKRFVDQLQTNYPATINTIVKTGDKLITEDKTLEDSTYCHLCKSPIQTLKTELTSAESTSFSHWVSTQPPNCNLPPVERFNEIFETFTKLSSSNHCFACKKLNNIVKSNS